MARVGGRPVPVEGFQRYLEEVTGERWQSIDDRVAVRLLDQFLDRQVMLAATGHVDPERDGSAAPTRLHTAQQLMVEACGEVPEPEPAAIEAEIDRRSAGAVRAPGVHLRQMLLDDQAAALEVCRRLERGEPWEELSREASLAPNAADGGEVGLVRRGSLPEELEAVVFALGEGEVSRPVQGPSRYHVFQVLEVDPGGPAAREEVAGAVRRELEAAATREHLRECLQRLAPEVGVSVEPRQLWFRYDGRYAEGPNVG